ncbi:MAG: KH domain-containing protein, partial [Planctomycetota bacterium]
AVLSGPREELSEYAPRIFTVMIDPERIGKLIGPGGKTIRGIQERTGATIDVEEDGTVYIGSTEPTGCATSPSLPTATSSPSPTR